MPPIDLKAVIESFVNELHEFKPAWSARIDSKTGNKVQMWASGFTLTLDILSDRLDSEGRYGTLRMLVFRDQREPLADDAEEGRSRCLLERGDSRRKGERTVGVMKAEARR